MCGVIEYSVCPLEEIEDFLHLYTLQPIDAALVEAQQQYIDWASLRNAVGKHSLQGCNNSQYVILSHWMNQKLFKLSG